MDDRTEKRMISVYDATTGVVLRSVAARPGGEQAMLRHGEAWREDSVDGRVNPLSGRVLRMQKMALVVGANRVSRIPDGAKVLVNDDAHAAINGVVTIDVTFASDVTVRVFHPAYEAETLVVPCDPANNTGAAMVPQDYAHLRAGHFPPLPEQMGAALKILKAMIASKPIPDDALAIIAQVDAVKDRFPKETEA